MMRDDRCGDARLRQSSVWTIALDRVPLLMVSRRQWPQGEGNASSAAVRFRAAIAARLDTQTKSGRCVRGSEPLERAAALPQRMWPE